MDASFLAFIAISVAIIVAPGPDTALTIRNAISGGRQAGLATALGVSVGQVVWAVTTSLGLVALILASEPFFRALQLAGAAYLCFLGFQSLRSALRGSEPSSGVGEVAAERSSLGIGRAFRQGLINDLANPKMAVFFASVLPQFSPPGQGMLSHLVLLGFVFAALTLAWLALYAWLVAAAGAALRSGGVRRALDGVAGVTLIGLGFKVATSER
jgi:threonine/homoserine/homoserine lactone efflux protein